MPQDISSTPRTLAIDATVAEALLKRFRPIVRAIQRALYSRVPDQAILISAGDEAIVMAYLTHNPAKAKLETWTRKQIHWHLAAAANQAPIADESFDPVQPKHMNGAGPEELFWRSVATRAIGRLNPREATIVTARMNGETYAEIAETLGISLQRVDEVGRRALRQLRTILEAEPHGTDTPSQRP